jgi:hypothetical protein
MRLVIGETRPATSLVANEILKAAAASTHRCGEAVSGGRADS